MPDIMSKEKRSYVMSRIRAKDTGPEKLLRARLDKENISYEIYKDLPGKPDVIINKVVIFVDGDFWHGYEFEKWKNKLSEFWRRKIENNIMRDKLVDKALRKKKYIVLRFWEHEIKNNIENVINIIKEVTKNAGPT